MHIIMGMNTHKSVHLLVQAWRDLWKTLLFAQFGR